MVDIHFTSCGHGDIRQATASNLDITNEDDILSTFYLMWNLDMCPNQEQDMSITVNAKGDVIFTSPSQPYDTNKVVGWCIHNFYYDDTIGTVNADNIVNHVRALHEESKKRFIRNNTR
ncbi:hypothetical protein EJ419_06255 [Alloscardovia theropitheci]|uniref:Uncharacterized protein n=1 Tax=Alloscardovia theropitheci TaxID=2496842 RepID=A0A4R0QWX9_9BIFI|nr:hypothetical protein [Alloscardovia theropitheci]TCD53851.1 hypothetical protein EJ419_06255 [Alloscardovia theropitheci]